MSDVLVLQITMLLLILIGALVKKIGIISSTGQKNINDLVINLVLPCNIVKSFLIDFDHQILRQFALVLVISSPSRSAVSSSEKCSTGKRKWATA